MRPRRLQPTSGNIRRSGRPPPPAGQARPPRTRCKSRTSDSLPIFVPLPAGCWEKSPAAFGLHLPSVFPGPAGDLTMRPYQESRSINAREIRELRVRQETARAPHMNSGILLRFWQREPKTLPAAVASTLYRKFEGAAEAAPFQAELFKAVLCSFDALAVARRQNLFVGGTRSPSASLRAAWNLTSPGNSV